MTQIVDQKVKADLQRFEELVQIGISSVSIYPDFVNNLRRVIQRQIVSHQVTYGI